MQPNRSIALARSARVLGIALLWLAALPPAASFAGDPARTGEQIFRQQCASCHGASGEGTDDHYPLALVGERSVASLARLIAKTMPEDAPGECVGEDAERVAAYIYDAFYSKSAQARNKFKPPRIELARLTVRQYRNAVTDLVGSFRSAGEWGSVRGLKADYFTRSRRRRDSGGGSSLSRIDPEVRFDFGTNSPIPAQNALKETAKRYQRLPVIWLPLDTLRSFSQEFRINWQGSIFAPETGEYEFLVKTENATRLLVNDKVRPVIDALVKSGNDTEYRGSIYLLGGRAYPLQLEMSRSKEKTSSVALEWKLPKRAFEAVPSRNLSPSSLPESFLANTPFPPDDRTAGYERGTSVSKEWDQATANAAIEVAGYIIAHLKELSGAAEGAADREAKIREFTQRFAERAFRRPLTGEQKAFFIDRQFKEARGLETGVKHVTLLLLMSPRFLYREIGQEHPDGYDVASRLSFGLWDSLPDGPLLQAAASGQLATREQVARQAERMVSDLRARSKLRSFLLQWLKVDQAAEIVKDPKQFPAFNEAVLADLRTSLDLFLDDVIGSERADFRELLCADYVYLNGRLAQLYGARLSADAPFQKVCLEPGERAGVLSHPYLMSSFAYTATSSPIHRGVFLARNVLGRVLRPPPEAVAPLAADLHPSLTTRERVTLQTKPEACQSCHGMINPLGFTLERFDAVGRYRTEEKKRPIDAIGYYETRAGDRVTIDGVRSLAAFLTDSEEAHMAFVQQLFHYLVKQPVRAFGRKELSDLTRFFAAHEFNIRKLMVEIMATTALTGQGSKP
jgi:mono/diheme cytochrome c family protein